MTEILHRKLNI